MFSHFTPSRSLTAVLTTNFNQVFALGCDILSFSNVAAILYGLTISMFPTCLFYQSPDLFIRVVHLLEIGQVNLIIA